MIRTKITRTKDGDIYDESLYFEIDRDNVEPKERKCVICGEHFLSAGSVLLWRSYKRKNLYRTRFDQVGAVCDQCAVSQSETLRRLILPAGASKVGWRNFKRLLGRMPESAWLELKAVEG